MRRTKPLISGKQIIFSSLSFTLVLSALQGNAQNMLPGRNEITAHKISAVIASKTMVVNEKSKKQYVDTVKYDMYGRILEKHITAYDTVHERQIAGTWTYTYDSLGNRGLETRNSPSFKVMNYFNYVYDSSRIKKQIWVYWVNMKLLFSRVYEVKYDGYGRLNLEMIEEGTEKLDSIIAFKYDSTNRMVKTICSSDKDFKDTINTVSYFYNPNGSVAKTLTTSKASKSVEEFTYDANGKLTKQMNDEGTTTYTYDKNGLLTTSEISMKGKKGSKYKYSYSYIYK